MIEKPFTYMIEEAKRSSIKYIKETLLTKKKRRIELKKKVGRQYPIYTLIFPGEYPEEFTIRKIKLSKRNVLSFSGKSVHPDSASERKASFTVEELSTDLLCEIADRIYVANVSKK